MIVQLMVPDLGESITEVQIGPWLAAVGGKVKRDEPIVEIESEKATVEVPAPVDGVLARILKQKGEPAVVGELIAEIETEIETKVEKHAEAATAAKAATIAAKAGERVERMSPMRRTIAARLVAAKQETALLTTFNEIDMSEVNALRGRVGAEFLAKNGVKLGLMSFFVKAVAQGLAEIPQINAQVRGDDIVYHDFCDIGIAVGGGKGLVVPVLRAAERASLAEIERRIADFGARAKTGKLTAEELEGGTFSITNGGVFGSLLSTPIVNPPQSAILGLHATQDRPVARDGQVVIRPMMYVALTYDHRIVDGREAVTFLKGVKLRMEAPAELYAGS